MAGGGGKGEAEAEAWRLAEWRHDGRRRGGARWRWRCTTHSQVGAGWWSLAEVSLEGPGPRQAYEKNTHMTQLEL